MSEADEISRLKWELLMVSKLAADKPMFFNPLNAAMAANIRDRVLSEANSVSGKGWTP